MRIGLALPQFDGVSVPGEDPLQFETVVEWARRAEQLGFDSVWLADHLRYDVGKYGAPRGGHDGFDPLVTLGALARATQQVQLGTLVLCAPLRAPGVVAKAMATLDVLSNGRMVVGLGAGWYAPEFAAAGVAFEPVAVRVARLAEAVQIVAGLFGGGPFAFQGEHYQVSVAHVLPRPVQRPRPEIWVGGRSDRLLEVAARHADGWNTVWQWTIDDYRERLDVLDAACERAGREPSSLTRTVGLYALVGDDERDLSLRFARLQQRAPVGVLDGMTLDGWRRGRLVGTADEVREQCKAWEDLGVSTLIVSAGALPFSVAAADDVESIAAAVR